MMPLKLNHTVLVIDSGVGGLSVYDKIRQLLPNLHYIYVFDNVAFPYGEKSEEIIIKRIFKIITTVQKKYSLSLAVIACNTASTVLLPVIEGKFSFPIIGVVPAIKYAAELTINGIVGLLATHGTIKHSYTRKTIEHFTNKCQINTLGSTELVKLAELKMSGKVVQLEKLDRILQSWIYTNKKPDTIILGCTHFSLLKEELLTVLPNGTNLVDSNITTALSIARFFRHIKLNIKNTKPNNVFCITLTLKARRLLPMFRRYGFETLEKLIL